MKLNSTYLKYLIRAHTVIGLFCIFLFFISTYFGSYTLFLPQINSWQNPSRHFEVIKNKEVNLDFTLRKALKELKYPNHNINIILPSYRDKTLSVSYGSSQKVHLNPYTNKVLDTANETNLITSFFNDIHLGRNIPTIGQLAMGVASLGIIFLSISGVFLWLVNKKKKATNKRFWFKWHKDLSLIMLPYIIVFSITGSFLGFMLSTSSTFSQAVTNGEEQSMRKLVTPILFAKEKELKKTEQNVDMIEYSKLFDKAKVIYPNLEIQKIVLTRWYEKNAQIAFVGHLKNNRILTGRINRIKLILSGIDASIIKKETLEKKHIINKVLSTFYILHFLPDEKSTLRLIILFMGILFAISMAFGLLIWIDKKAKKYKNDKNYYNFISKLSLAVIIGVIPASSLFLCLYWILPFDIYERETWILGTFYMFWSWTLFYSIYKNSAFDVIKLFMILNFLFLVFAVFLHGFKTDFYIWNSFNQNITDVFWVDFSFLLFAIISLFISFKFSKLKLLEKYKPLEKEDK